MNNTNDQQSSIKNTLRNLLVYIGPLIGLTGLSLAIYYHMQSIQERIPTYYVSPQRASIVNETGPAPSELQVLHNGVLVRASSIVALTVYFWNDGKMPIRKTDILEPLFINLPVNTEILEARILKVSRPVVKFEKSEISAEAKNALPISFDILEKGDGAAIQITYAGQPDAPLEMSGVIVGAGTVRSMSSKRAEDFFKRREPKESLKNERVVMWIFLGFASVSTVAGIVLWVIRKRRGTPKRASLPLTMIVAGVIYFGLGFYTLHGINQAFSPGVPASIWLQQ
jgi:hypothetical protein